MIPYSVLDLAIVTEGNSIAGAIQNSRDLAIHTEKYGYTLFTGSEVDLRVFQGS